MNIHLEIIINFILLITVYLFSYLVIKRGKIEYNEIKKARWMAFGISLVVLGVVRIVSDTN